MENQRKLHKIGKITFRSSLSLEGKTPTDCQQSEPNSAIEMNGLGFCLSDYNQEENYQNSYSATVSTPALVSHRRFRKKNYSKQSTVIKEELGCATHKKTTEIGNLQHFVKIADLLKLFYQKITINSVLRKPVIYDPLSEDYQSERSGFWFQLNKIELPKSIENSILMAKIIYIIVYYFAFPLSILYSQLQYSSTLLTLKLLGIVFNCIDIIEACQISDSKDETGSSLQMQQKQRHQKKTIVIEFLVLISSFVSILCTQQSLRAGTFLFFGMSLNIKGYLGKINCLEGQFFTASHYEQYWDLVKVICMNLLVCHLLACALIGITGFHQGASWMTATGIDKACWYQQYIWSYYFGTTIILTIGFGDLHPANHVEAFFIIFISFFACLFFGYNINYIGNLINSIRQDEIDKHQKLKILGSLAKKTEVSKLVHEEITNYIVQESKIKQESNYTQQRKLLNELPQTLRSTFLQQANQKLFNHLKKIIPFTNKTIEKLSLSIQARFCHPSQTIKRYNDPQNLMILQSGEVGFIARGPYNCLLNNITIQRISNTLKQQSKLICVDLLSNEPLNYDIKSLAYSVVYQMNKSQFQLCVNHSKQDYQIYREALDRCKYKLNQFALIKCRYCENKLHTLFQCPKLHYTPFRRTLPLKYHQNRASQKQNRVQYIRNKKSNVFDVVYEKKYPETDEQDNQVSESLKNNIPKQISNRIGRIDRHSNNNNYRTNTGQNILFTMEMMTQIRDDIKNLKRQSRNHFQFTLWENIQCDQIHNFKYYFPKNNADQMRDRKFKHSFKNWSNKLMKKGKKMTDTY